MLNVIQNYYKKMSTTVLTLFIFENVIVLKIEIKRSSRISSSFSSLWIYIKGLGSK